MGFLSRVWLFTLLLLVACGGSDGSGGTFDIPKTTKVTDDATRAALTAYSPDDGTLRFARSTGVLDGLAPGDVLVSSAAPAAPQGLLRRVESIDRSGGDVVVHTSQAALTDAVHRGSASGRKKVTLADVQGPSPLPSGLSLQGGVGTKGIKPLSGAPPAGGINLVFDHFTLQLGHDTSTSSSTAPPTQGGSGGPSASVSGQVAVTGYVHLDPEILFDLSIGLNPAPYVQHFKVGVELNQSSDIQVDAQISAGIKYEYTYTFVLGVFDIQLGYVPIVIAPVLDLTVGVSGSATVSLSFHETEGIDLVAGTEYLSDSGWHDISHATSQPAEFDIAGQPTLQLDAQLYPKAEFRLAVYGVAGPYINLQPALDLSVAVPRNPFAELQLLIQGTIGVRVRILSVDLLDANFPFLNVAIPLWQSDPIPPTIRITSPPPNATFHAGDAIRFDATAFDLQDGLPNVAWTSDVDGAIATGASVSRTLLAHGPGPRTITATATNAEGKSTSVSVPIVIVPSAPTVTIAAPLALDRVYAGQSTTFAANVRDLFSADPCADPAWTISWTSDVNGGAGTGCTAQATFAPAGSPASPVTAHVTVTVHDPWGGQATANTTITVQPPPPIAINVMAPANPPIPSIIEMSNAALPPAIALQATATDPSFPGDTLSYAWFADAIDSTNGSVAQTIAIGTGASTTWQVASAPASFLDRLGTAQVLPGRLIHVYCKVSDQHGYVIQSSSRSIYYLYEPS